MDFKSTIQGPRLTPIYHVYKSITEPNPLNFFSITPQVLWISQHNTLDKRETKHHLMDQDSLKLEIMNVYRIRKSSYRRNRKQWKCGLKQRDFFLGTNNRLLMEQWRFQWMTHKILIGPHLLKPNQLSQMRKHHQRPLEGLSHFIPNS
jgi:hypothetical protein